MTPCPTCDRHIFDHERACPFCAVPRAPRRGSLAAVALTAAIACADKPAVERPPDPPVQTSTGTAAPSPTPAEPSPTPATPVPPYGVAPMPTAPAVPAYGIAPIEPPPPK